MLNPFPELLTYSLLAPLILRVIVGFVLIDLGKFALTSEKESWIVSFKTLKIPLPEITVKLFGFVQIIFGIMLLVGVYTQIAAIILAILVLVESYIEYKDPSILKRSFVFYILILSILISLIFSGAGSFAFDIPL